MMFAEGKKRFVTVEELGEKGASMSKKDRDSLERGYVGRKK